jgi:membrane protein implicated in regulation of membrane protease activity
MTRDESLIVINALDVAATLAHASPFSHPSLTWPIPHPKMPIRGKIRPAAANNWQILLSSAPRSGGCRNWGWAMVALTWFFLICAVVGGTVLICQFVLTLVGLGGDHVGVGDHSAFDGGAHDFHADVGHDVHIDGTHGAESAGHDAADSHGSSWLFAVISFRTLVAAATFFGLAGLAAQSADQPMGVQLLLGAIAGLGAMYGVHWMVRTMGRLGEDATIRVRSALGKEGTVYIPIPAAKTQAGKIQLKLQNRLVEYEAVTSGPARLATGTKVRVVGITGGTLEVEPLAKTGAA